MVRNMAEEQGLEPRLPGPEPDVLPLDDSSLRKPETRRRRILQRVRLLADFPDHRHYWQFACQYTLLEMCPLFGSLDESAGMPEAHDCPFVKYPDIIVLMKIKGKREKTGSGNSSFSRFLTAVLPLLRGGGNNRGRPAEIRKRRTAAILQKSQQKLRICGTVRQWRT